MPAQLLSGLSLSQTLRQDIARAVATLKLSPGLAVILVGDDPASAIYVRNKVKACQECGFRSLEHRLPADVSQAHLLAMIDDLNRDPAVNGILVQLPLPKHLDSNKVIAAIAPHKDVDGLHPENAGLLLQNQPRFIPCTPLGVMKLLEKAAIPLRGAQAVVVGASNIVGKPLALLLLHAGATVTLCNSKTRDIAAHTSTAEIVVAAVGKPGFIRAEMLRPGVCAIDVGINRLADGTICGDIAPTAATVASFLTPVPGGVGPMTITMLMTNTLTAARLHAPH